MPAIIRELLNQVETQKPGHGLLLELDRYKIYIYFFGSFCRLNRNWRWNAHVSLMNND